MDHPAPYFANHDRRRRFPWSLYHRGLEQRLASAVRSLPGAAPRVLVVGCGLEPFVPGVEGPTYHGADIDEASIRRCGELYPALAGRLAVCPNPYQLPTGEAFDVPFDAIVAKEVIEHLDEPERWLQALAERLAPGGQLLLTTPNYGPLSTLPLLESTLLELVAWRDGYSRKHIHPSRFTRRRLMAVRVPGLGPFEVETTATGWALFASARKLGAVSLER